MARHHTLCYPNGSEDHLTAGYEDPQHRRGTSGEPSRQSRLRADDDSRWLEYNRYVARG